MVPPNYHTPAFPSLYWPINPLPSRTHYLYYPGDIWRFTLLWTLISYGVCFGMIGLWGWAMVALGGRARINEQHQHQHHQHHQHQQHQHQQHQHQQQQAAPHTSPPYSSRANVIGGGSGNRNGNTQRRGNDSDRGVCADWWFGAGWLLSVVVVGGIEAVLGGSVVGLMLVPVPLLPFHPFPPLCNTNTSPIDFFSFSSSFSLPFPSLIPFPFFSLFFYFLSTEKRKKKTFFSTKIAWRQSTTRASSA